MIARLGAGAALALAMIVLGAPADAGRTFVVIGTGGVTGVYFLAGGATCRVVNESRADHGVRCSVEATAGSVHNVGAVVSGDIDIGIVQADVQFQAMRGEGPFANRPNLGLRTLFSLHDEAFTVVARADSDIRWFSDLAGRRVNIGNVGSGQRSAMDMLMEGLGWDESTFEETLELTSRDQAQALCDGRVDAIVFVAGHPNASIREALGGCDSVLVPLRPELIAALTGDTPFLSPVKIDAKLYGLPPVEITSFGTVATIVASESMDPCIAHAFTRAVFEGLGSVAAATPGPRRVGTGNHGVRRISRADS